jgi:hypothetical protein
MAADPHDYAAADRFEAVASRRGESTVAPARRVLLSRLAGVWQYAHLRALVEARVEAEYNVSDFAVRMERFNQGDRYFDRTGRPIRWSVWGKLGENEAYRRVAETRVDSVRVSTIWLGINHRFGSPGSPLIFETMVFGGQQIEENQWRYSTEEEALEGHQTVVSVLAASPPDVQSLIEYFDREIRLRILGAMGGPATR